MPREEHTFALGSALAAYGLDLNRYTTAHAHGFLARWPNPGDWASSDARSALISTFAIGETTFMRHPEHFAAVRALLPDLHRHRAGMPLRVWSAGCASGEEAYSLGATLAPLGRSSFELVAWDINPEAVARAVAGEYRPWSLRGVDVQATQGWLAPAPCGVRVESWLRELIRFQVGNLHADSYPEDLDLIFCRNVLLYFRREAAARVLARMAESLRPGGVLFLGHYDPMPDPQTGLVAENVNGTIFYRKGGSARRSITTETRTAFTAEARVQVQTSPFVLDPHVVSAAENALKSGPAARMDAVRLLANQRRMSQALQTLAELRSGSALRPELHILTALVAEDAGEYRLMLEAARKACFLLPDQPGPNYFLSVAFVRNGELRRAALHRRIAAAALRNEPQPSSIVEYSEGLTVGQLRRLVGAIAR